MKAKPIRMLGFARGVYDEQRGTWQSRCTVEAEYANGDTITKAILWGEIRYRSEPEAIAHAKLVLWPPVQEAFSMAEMEHILK